MLNKLAFKNVSKSFKDYAIYFFTLIFGVCIFYMFNSIEAQKSIMEATTTVSAAMKIVTSVLSYLSVFVSVILGFLIVYANRFFIQRRKKEIGIYQMLGMSKRKISLILVMETTVMAIMALTIGLILGIFLSQFMSVFTAKLFEANMTKFKFIFSSTAMIKSIIYFAIIFAVVIIFNVITISKYKLIDLIYGSRKNEKIKLDNIKISIILFILSLICLGVTYYFIIKIGLINLDGLLAIFLLLGVIGTVLFFFSLTGFFIKFIKTKKNIYFKNLNVFVLKQINSKVNTNFISMSVVCLLLLLTIGILSCGISLKNVFSYELKDFINYDVSFFGDENNDVIKDKLPKNLLDNKFIKNSVEFKNYQAQNIKYSDLKKIDSKEYEYVNNYNVSFMLLSDLNKILTYNNQKTETLKENEYLIISNNKAIKEYAQCYMSENIKIKLNNNELLPKKFIDTLTSNGGDLLTFVVNDEYEPYLIKDYTILNIDLTDYEKYGEEYDNLVKDYMNNTTYEELPFLFSTSKFETYTASVTTKVILSFLAIYLGIIFLITSSVILAIQQLTEAEDNKTRYKLLNKLGADKEMLNKALFKQIFIYFMLPLSLAIIHSVFGLVAANDVISKVGKVDILGSLFITGSIIVVVYGLYFVITYIGSKNIINRK